MITVEEIFENHVFNMAPQFNGNEEALELLDILMTQFKERATIDGMMDEYDFNMRQVLKLNPSEKGSKLLDTFIFTLKEIGYLDKSVLVRRPAMSEMGDDFKAWHEEKRTKKNNNLVFSTELLKKNNINFSSHNHGVHLIVEKNFDFYPSTGKFIDRVTKKHGRGVKNLLSLIQGNKL